MSSDDPVSRKEVERALRFLNNTVTQMRDELLQLGAQVVTLTRKLEEKGQISQQEVMDELPAAVDQVRTSDEGAPPLRVELSDHLRDKNQVESPPVPCAELMPICKARCCKLAFVLSTQDLEERVVRWDYGRPYWNLRREDGYCVHNQAETGGCGVYQHRPAPCRAYDCRYDRRIWTDFDKRILAPDRTEHLLAVRTPPKRDEVADSARDRHTAMDIEDAALRFDRR